MPFLRPYFEYDVFVSYSHGVRGRETDEPLKDWTLELIRRLENDVHAVDTEFDDLIIWRDEKIDPTIYLSDELRSKVTSSGILMIVMSPRYLASTWCKDELEWFRQQVLDRARDQGRVFVIRALPTDETAWPDFLRDTRGYALPGFQFHDKQDRMPYLWRGGGTNRDAYVQELWRLHTALVARLRELRANGERRAKSDMPEVALLPGGPRRIYLHARPKYASIYDEVKRVLSQEGIAPLSAVADPGRNIADWTRESRARVETVMTTKSGSSAISSKSESMNANASSRRAAPHCLARCLTTPATRCRLTCPATASSISTWPATIGTVNSTAG